MSLRAEFITASTPHVGPIDVQRTAPQRRLPEWLLEAGQAVVEETPRQADVQPFLNLESTGTRISAKVLKLAAAAMVCEMDYPAPQGQTGWALRRDIIAELSLPKYAANNPADLPSDLRSEDWQHLVLCIENWPSLSFHSQARVLTVLNKLSLYELSLALAPATATQAVAWDCGAATIELRRLLARSKVVGADEQTVEGLEALALGAPDVVSHQAATLLVVHHGRFTRSRELVERWTLTAQASRPDSNSGTAMTLLTESILLRATCFVPMLLGSFAAVRAMLNEAVALSAEAKRLNQLPTAFLDENMFALTQTRMNVAKAMGDSAGALEMGESLVLIDEREPQSHNLLGDQLWSMGSVERAYAEFALAARLGPGNTSQSWYCAARCLEQLGDTSAAFQHLCASLATDPMAMSPLIALRRVTANAHGGAGGIMTPWVENALSEARRTVMKSR